VLQLAPQALDALQQHQDGPAHRAPVGIAGIGQPDGPPPQLALLLALALHGIIIAETVKRAHGVWAVSRRTRG
jgi:hypothetical protein